MKTKKTMKPKMNMNVKSILTTAALIIVVVALGTCESLPATGVITDPAISFESVSLKGLNFTGADMLAKIKIQNDNPIAIPFPEINWNLFVAETSFLKGIVPEGTKIAARGSTIAEIPFSVPYEGLYKTVTKLLSVDEAPYRIDLDTRFPIPLLDSKTFKTSFNGSLPVPKMPTLSFSGIKFNSISLSKVEFVMTWLIDNKNAFALNLNKLNYNFAVNGAPWASGAAENKSFPAKGSTQLPITVNVSSVSMIQEIVALAVGRKEVDYTCNGDISLSPQGFENFAALTLPFTHSGKTTIRN